MKLENINCEKSKNNSQIRIKIFSIFAILFGIICIVYDITLICLCPGTFWDNVISFTHIWSVLGGYHIFTGIWRIKNKKIFIKTWQKAFKLTVVSLVAIAFFAFGISLVFILTPNLVRENEQVEYVILLGGGIDKNGVLPKSVQKRVEAAAEFLSNQKNAICVVSGGQLDFLPVAEAPELKRYLIEKGFDSNRILVEDKAEDTIQNFQYSCKMLADYKGISQQEILNSRIAVVSSHYHLRRAERLAKRMGFTYIKGVPSKIPAINVVHSYVREVCAYVKLNLRILFTRKPEKIC